MKLIILMVFFMTATLIVKGDKAMIISKQIQINGDANTTVSLLVTLTDNLNKHNFTDELVE